MGWLKYPANSGSLQQLKSKNNFFNFLFSFWGCRCNNIQQIQRDIPRKKFLKTLNLFSQPKLNSKEKERLNNVYPSSNDNELIITIFFAGKIVKRKNSKLNVYKILQSIFCERLRKTKKKE